MTIQTVSHFATLIRAMPERGPEITMEKFDKKAQFHIGYFLIAILGILLVRDLWLQSMQVEPIPYNEFTRLLEEGEVKEVIITDNYIRGVLKNPGTNKKEKFVTSRVETDLANELQKYDIKYTRIIENTFWRDLLSWTLPALLFIGVWIFLVKRLASKGGLGGGGGLMSIGSSKAKIYVETDIKTRFDDVAGIDEAKEELVEIVNFLKDQDEYGRLGARMPKGALLVGPPGTGKTLLAKAIAGEASVPFFFISGSEFVEMFVGVGAARVRDLFEQAKKHAPCIIFIDELDALGKARGSHPMVGGHDEKEQTLNQLLVEMDGFDSKTGIVILAATNRPEILDPALLRAGRFDRQILIDRPDKRGRIEILNVHIKKIKVSSEVALEEVAALTAGFTGADLENLVNEAALIATRRHGEAVNLNDFTTAVERIVAGLEKKNRLLNPMERKVVAYHEMGHTLVAAAIPGCDPVHKVSIIPRGVGALGYTIQRPTEDRFLMTKDELENKMAVLLGGRAAEKIIFNHLSTGAADDINRATDVARSMVMKYGMEENLGSITYEVETTSFLGNVPDVLGQNRRFSEETAREIDCAVKELVDNAFQKASTLLENNKDVLLESAEVLLSKETLVQTDLKPFFARIQPDSSVQKTQ